MGFCSYVDRNSSIGESRKSQTGTTGLLRPRSFFGPIPDPSIVICPVRTGCIRGS